MAYTATLVVPPVIETPATGTQTYKVRLYLYDSNTAMMAPDSTPTLGVFNASGTTLPARLSAASLLVTGVYEWTYTADAAHDTEQILWGVSVVRTSVTSFFAATSLIVASIDAIKAFTSSGTLDGILDASALTAIGEAVVEDPVMTTRLLSQTAATKLERSARCIGVGTVGAGSTDQIVVIGSQSPAKTTGAEFKDRLIIFPEDTPTSVLRGAFAVILTGGTNTQHLLDRVLPAAPAGPPTPDIYSIN